MLLKFSNIGNIISKRIKNNTVIVFFISYLFILQNIRWQAFGDEFDNILGGIVLANGGLIYKDYFSQHPPFVYFFTSVFAKLGIQSVEAFRVIFSLFILSIWIFVYKYFRKYIKAKTILIFIFLSAVSHYIYWGNMLLSDTFFAYSALVLLLLFVKYLHETKFTVLDLIILSIFTYISIMSALISVYPIIFGYFVWVVYDLSNYKKHNLNIKQKLSQYLEMFVILVIPYVITLFIMYISGNFKDFIFGAYTFNKVYYSKYTLSGSTNTLLIIAIKDYAGFIKDTIFNFKLINMFEVLIVLSNMYAIFKLKDKSWFLAISLFIFTMLLRMRGGYFHAIPYYIVSLFIMANIYSNYNNKKNIVYVKKILLCMFSVFLILGYISTCFGSVTTKYKQWYKSPIYDYIQKLTDENDKIWSIPYDCGSYIYTERLPATSHAGYMPWEADSNMINNDIINDLRKNRPKLIILAMDADIWGHKLSQYLNKDILRYINENYEILNKDNSIEKSIYIRKDVYDISRKKLGYISEQDIIINQNIKDTVVGEINKDVVVSQTFKLKNSIITEQLNLFVGTYARKNKGTLKIEIFDGDKIIFSQNISKESIIDNDYLKIYTNNLKLIKDKSYKINISDKCNPGNGITIYSSKVNIHSPYELFINSIKQNGNIAFRIIKD